MHLEAFSLDVTPVPVVQSEHLDAHDNLVSELTFSGTTRSLTVNATAVVDRVETNPFQFLVAGGADLLEHGYPPALAMQLAAYRQAPGDLDGEVVALARRIADTVQSRPDVFAAALATHLHDTVTHEVRWEGDPRPPVTTLELGRGSCRDVAVLFVGCCRAVGLAARFVSGYAHDGGGRGTVEPELHAWGEVFVPGGGWRGFDPTDGLAVSRHHIALATAALASNAAPVSGTFRGSGVTATLSTRLDIQSTAPDRA